MALPSRPSATISVSAAACGASAVGSMTKGSGSSSRCRSPTPSSPASSRWTAGRSPAGAPSRQPKPRPHPLDAEHARPFPTWGHRPTFTFVVRRAVALQVRGRALVQVRHCCLPEMLRGDGRGASIGTGRQDRMAPLSGQLRASWEDAYIEAELDRLLQEPLRSRHEEAQRMCNWLHRQRQRLPGASRLGRRSHVRGWRRSGTSGGSCWSSSSGAARCWRRWPARCAASRFRSGAAGVRPSWC
jgi:hypothetical protein